MGPATANCPERGIGSSSINPKITLQGWNYHYKETLLPADHLTPSISSVYIFDIDDFAQPQHRTRSVLELDVRSMQQLIEMLYQLNLYIWAFKSLRKWTLGDQAPITYQMIIHADRHPPSGHVTRYKGPTYLGLVAIMPSTENVECARGNLMLHLRWQLNANDNEALDTISVNHYSYDHLC